MRTKGILLVRDTILLLSVLPTDGECYASTPQRSRLIHNLPAPDVQLGLWRRSCDRVLASLERFSPNLLNNSKMFHDLGDKEGADVIASSCIACLAHLAILYEVVCRIDPVSGFKLYGFCDSALRRLGMLTSKLRLDEYTHLDLLLGVRPSSCSFPMTMTQTGDG